MNSTKQPEWNSFDKSESLKEFGKWLHEEAMRVFAKDKTHTQIIFMFDAEEGLISVNQVPPNTSNDQIINGVRQAVIENNIYGVVSVAEAWTYFPKGKRDHTVVQLMHNEMGVADLNEDDKTEALMVRLESRDGDHITWINEIIRDGDNTKLGSSALLPKDKCINFKCWFDG